MEKLITEEGIVGFFDILGYSNLLENNEPETVANNIISTLNNIRDDLLEYNKRFFSEFTGKEPPSILNLFKNIKHNVFSDTILITLAYEENITTRLKNVRWLFFLLNSIFLYRHLFDQGIPIRGSITFGKFIVHKNCFAGRSIIDAYNLSQRLV